MEQKILEKIAQSGDILNYWDVLSFDHMGIRCYNPTNADEIEKALQAAGMEHIQGMQLVREHTNFRLYPDGTYMRCIELSTKLHSKIISYDNIIKDLEEINRLFSVYEATHGSGAEDAADAGSGERRKLAGE